MERAWFNMHKCKREDGIRNITFAFCMLIPIILIINAKMEDVNAYIHRKHELKGNGINGTFKQGKNRQN